jgi:hypothetical protein
MFQVVQSMNTYNQSYISHIPLNSRCLDGLLCFCRKVIISCEIELFGIIVLILSIKVMFFRAYANGSFLLEFYCFLIELADVFANIRMFRNYV